MIIITIPAYNEEASIGKTLEDIKKVMEGYTYEVHIQNDGSTDKTKQVAESYGAKVFSNNGNLGLAKTFIAEMENAKDANIIIHTDSDGQYQSKHIPELIKKVQEGYDLVLGSRFLGKDRYSGSFMKRIGNKMFALMMSNLTKMKITDGTTGFRAFNQKVAKLPITNRFTYTHEQIIRASRKKFKIVEIPIDTNPTRESKLFKSPFQYMVKAVINILRLYRDFDPIRFFGKIGLMTMLPGFLIWIYMLINFIFTGHVGLLNLTLLSYFFIGIGFLIIVLSLIADMNVED